MISYLVNKLLVGLCVSHIFTCGEADRSSRGKLVLLLSFFLNESSKEGQNSPNKHGSICSLGHKFQI